MSRDAPALSVDRRTFIMRLGAALAGMAGAAAWGFAFWDRKGPGIDLQKEASLLPDFRVAGGKPALFAARGEERGRMLAEALGGLGGIGHFVKPGERVLLKVNAAFAAPPALGATTHPDLVRELCRLCRQAGAARVIVTDNPINHPASCFELSGIAAAARAGGADVLLPATQLFESYTLPGAALIRRWPVLAGPLRQVDRVIGVAPVKDHHRSGASMTLKNWYGLLGGRRNIFHQQIHTIIAELGLMIKPTLVILDGTASMVRNGPTGGSLDDLKPTRTLIAGTDPVAVDAMGAQLLGRSLDDLPYLRLAEKAGAGTTDFRTLLR